MEHAAHGPSPTLIKDMLVFLLAAGILVPALRWLKMPTIIAFMLAGVALGPFALGHFAEAYPVLTYFSITEPEAALPFAELGVLFLLFLLGVEFSFKRLWALRKVVLGAGGMQTVLSAAAIALVGFALGLDPARGRRRRGRRTTERSAVRVTRTANRLPSGRVVRCLRPCRRR